METKYPQLHGFFCWEGSDVVGAVYFYVWDTFKIGGNLKKNMTKLLKESFLNIFKAKIKNFKGIN